MKEKPVGAVVLALCLGLSLTACGNKDTRSPFQRSVDRPIRLSVDNNNFLDVTVYAVAGGSSLRIGQVTGKSSGRFTLDPRRIPMSAGLQLLVDPLGSNRTYLSPRVFPDGSGTLVLNVAAIVDRSVLFIR